MKYTQHHTYFKINHKMTIMSRNMIIFTMSIFLSDIGDYLFQKYLQISDWIYTFVLERSSLLICKLNFVQYPEGPLIKFKWFG